MNDNDKALVERLREAQCPDNMGCNPLAKYCQCVQMDEAADRIEALEARLAEADALIEKARAATVFDKSWNVDAYILVPQFDAYLEQSK